MKGTLWILSIALVFILSVLTLGVGWLLYKSKKFLFLIILLACQDVYITPAPTYDKGLEVLVSRIKQEAELRGKEFNPYNKPERSWKFTNLDGDVGAVIGSVIYLDYGWYLLAGEDAIFIAAHEYGHYYLNYEHGDTYAMNNLPTTVDHEKLFNTLWK